jgi:D-inositol-3-phosphate glycosyltransferase
VNIGILCNSGAWGGLEINNLKLALWLKERGHMVTFLTNPNENPYRYAEKWYVPVVPYYSYSKWVDFSSVKQLIRLIKVSKIEAILIGHSKDISTAVWAKIFSGNKVKLIYLQQMNIGVKKKDPLHTFFYSFLDFWITPLELQQQDVLSKTRFPKQKIVLQPLSIELEKFKGVRSHRKEARELFGLPQEAFVAGMIGRPDPGKGHLYFIRALASLKKEGQEVHGFILGLTGHDYLPYVQQVLDEIKSHGLENNVHIKPFNEKPEMGYAALDVFVMASVDEAFGMVTVEAMAAGVPVVGTNRKGPLEILKNGEYGLMVPVENSEALAEAILKYKLEPAFATAMSEKASHYAWKTFSHHKQCEVIEELISRK